MTYFSKNNQLDPKYSKKDIYILRLAFFLTIAFMQISVVMILKYFNYDLDGDAQSKWDLFIICASCLAYLVSAMFIFLSITKILVEITIKLSHLIKSYLND